MAYQVDVYDKKGKKVDTIELNPSLFADENINESLIHEYYLLQMANARQTTAHTKTRSEVAGSGKKLYRQKGTGNARVGDRRSPIRVGGGVAFGPRNERNYTKHMTKKARKKALCGLITLKAKDGEMMGLQSFDLKAPKTKDATMLLDAIGVANKKVLLVIDQKNDVVEKSFRNIDRTKYVLVDYLNPRDLLHHDVVVFMQPALEKINQS